MNNQSSDRSNGVSRGRNELEKGEKVLILFEKLYKVCWHYSTAYIRYIQSVLSTKIQIKTIQNDMSRFVKLKRKDWFSTLSVKSVKQAYLEHTPYYLASTGCVKKRSLVHHHHQLFCGTPADGIHHLPLIIGEQLPAATPRSHFHCLFLLQTDITIYSVQSLTGVINTTYMVHYK